VVPEQQDVFDSEGLGGLVFATWFSRAETVIGRLGSRPNRFSSRSRSDEHMITWVTVADVLET
jgi:hypothetical protein